MTMILRALRHRNFRIFFIGQGISLTGTWMQQVATGWLVYRLTGSPWMLGVTGFANQIPILLLAPFAGVLADRWNKRKLLLVTQGLSMAQAAVLAVIVASGAVSVPWLIGLSLTLGLLNAFDVPVRQSFFAEMIDTREDLGNAIALNSSMFNAARLVGPPVAGLLIAWKGEAVCFLVNALTYVPVLVALSLMKIPKKHVDAGPRRVFREMKDGFSYLSSRSELRNILLLLSLFGLVGYSYMVLLPVFAREIYGGGPRTLGFLVGAIGLGALAGAMLLAGKKDTQGLERHIVRSTALFGTAMVLFSFSRDLRLTVPLMFVAGFAMMSHLASSNTILQTVVHDEKRGRVMSFYTVAVIGLAPIGSLLAGYLAGMVGVQKTVLILGVFSLAGSIVYSRTLLADP
jgi:MFS family permease